MSRHHINKTVWIQLTNVVVNVAVCLLTYQMMGLYGFVLGNSVAILSSLMLCLYYQNVYLGRIGLDSQQIRRLVTIMVLVDVPCLLVSSLLTEPWLRLGLISLATLLVYGLLLRRSYKFLASLAT